MITVQSSSLPVRTSTLWFFTFPLCLQGHCRSGTLPDHHQAVLQTSTGNVLKGSVLRVVTFVSPLEGLRQLCPSTKYSVSHMLHMFRSADLRGLSTAHLLFTIFISVAPQGIFLVYDITSERSFQHIMKWASDVDEVNPMILFYRL